MRRDARPRATRRNDEGAGDFRCVAYSGQRMARPRPGRREEDVSRRWFCWHRWEQDRPFDGTEGFPPPNVSHSWFRKCVRCGKAQKWLPGYGGSEWGGWIDTKRAATSNQGETG